MPKSFLTEITSRKRHLLYGTAIGVLLMIGASDRVYADCPAFTPNDDNVDCQGALTNVNALSGNDIVRLSAVDAGGNNFTGDANNDQITLISGSLTNLLGSSGNDQLTILSGTVQNNVLGEEGDDILAVVGPGIIGGDLSGGVGNDTITFTGATLGDDILGGDGNDTVSIAGGQINGEVALGADNDTVVMTGGVLLSAGTDIRLEAGDDAFTMTGGIVEDDIIGAVGNDQITMTGGFAEQISGGDHNDTISIGGTAVLASASENVVGGAGDDLIIISGGNIENDVNASEGNDQITITGGSIGEDVRGGADNDVMFVQNATIDGQFRGEVGDDQLIIESGADIAGAVAGNDGEDQVTMLGGQALEIFGGSGNDAITVSGGSLVQEIQGDDGNDTLSLAGGFVGFDILGNSGNDLISVSGGTVVDDVQGNDGDDVIHISGGVVGAGLADGEVQGNTGNDSISISGGSLLDDVEGGVGDDLIFMSGGFVGQEIEGQDGNDLISMSGGSVSEDIEGDSGNDQILVSGGFVGSAVEGNDGNDEILISGTADLQGVNIEGDTGNDVIRLTDAGNLSGADILGDDGNDLIELGSGLGDVLSGVDSLFGGSGSNDIAQYSGFAGVNAETFGAFEQMLLLNGTTLDVHNPNAPTLNDVTLGELYSGTDEFIVYLDPTSTLFAGGTSPGDTTILGNVANQGQLSMLDGTANDVFTVTGAYAGGGTGELALDAALDATELGDRFFFSTVESVDVPPPIGPTLVPPGSLAEGTTAVIVQDVGNGIGQLTGTNAGDGIAVIDVSGGDTDDDDFFLLGGPIQAGAVEYDLVLQTDNIWYLQSDFLDQVFGYAAAPSAVLNMARDYMGNLHERVGSLEQTWSGGATQISDGSGVWLRSGGFFGKVDSGKDDQRFDYDQNHWFAQVGADLALMSDASTGQLIGSIMGHYGHSETTQDEKGNTQIVENHINAYGGGVALTWYGGPAGGWFGEGLYVDGIAQFTFYDLKTKTDAEGKRGETDGWGWSVGLEAGYGINVGGDRDGPYLVPQIQIVYSQVKLDDFNDEEGVDVDFDNADSLQGRIGLAVDSGKMWRSVNAYAEANIVHEFLGDTDVTVTTLPVDYDLGGTSAELGMGGTVSLLDNVFIYADVDYLIPFDDGRKGASVIGGLRVAF